MKYILLLSLFILFTGCYDTSPTSCKNLGYKGILIRENDVGDDVCSDGTIINGYYLTRDGEVSKDSSTYFDFNGSINWANREF